METKRTWRLALIIGGAGVIALALPLMNRGPSEATQQAGHEEPCDDPGVHSHLSPEQRATLGPAELATHHDEAKRRARANRRALMLLESDPRWDDPQQVPFLAEAMSATGGLAIDYEDQADAIEELLECQEAESAGNLP